MIMVITPSISKFYCHSCTEEIDPKPDYTCPKCENGFIEEITETTESPGSTSPHDITDPSSITEIWGRAFLENFQQQVSGVNQDRPQRSTSSDDRTESDSEDTETENPYVMTHSNGALPFTRIRVRTRNNRQQQNPRQVPYLQGLLQMFVDRLTDQHGPSLNFVPIHGNPGDYAWGVHGLDNIITQLLNQLEGSGPAPAEKCKIDSVPIVKITQKQADEGAQCAICFEDFAAGEEAKRLPCDHHYHDGCIVTWLEMHGTCPVCRKDLNGIDSSLQDNYPTPADIIDSSLTSRNNNTEDEDS